MKKTLLWIISLAACLCFSTEQVWPQTRIRIGITSASFGHAPYYVARDMGFYKKEGLDTEVIVMNRDDLSLQALVADSIHFGVIPPNLILNVRQRGLTNIKMIAGSFNGTTYSLIALPKYKKLEDLKGSRLAVSSLTAGSTLMMMYVLKQRGLIFPRDYTVINAGGSTTRWVALQSK
jgi:ABC-type nitrate/sulfonate/bicarbonate transport system substrate-binding protein